MHNAKRGIRNVTRSKVRTITVALLIGLAMCLSITMMAIEAAVEAQVASVEATIGTMVEIRPAGSFGGFGRAEPMSASVLEGMSEVPNIVEIAPMVAYQHVPRLSGAQMRDRTALEELMRNRMAVMGIVPGQALRLIGGGTAEVVEGRSFEAADDGQKVAIVGVTYAKERELTVGDTIVVNEQEFNIVGLASSGNRFGDSSVFLPLTTAQTVLEMPDQLSQVYVTVNTLANVETVVAALKEIVGETADVVSQGDVMLQRVSQSMDLVRGTTNTGLWLALGTGGLVIFFTMLLVIRERQKEIGVLKAIGSSNFDLLSGFAWEALAIAALGTAVGVLLFTTAGQSIASRVIAQAIPTAPQSIGSGLRGGGPALGGAIDMQGMRQFAQSMMRGGMFQSQLGNITVSMSGTLLARSLLSAVGLGLLGGLLPALWALRLKPAEVLRND